MKSQPQFTDYPIHIRYSHEDKAYLASMPAFQGLITDGATPQAALEELETAFEGFIASYTAYNQPIPDPKAILIQSINRLKPILSISKLAKKAQINHHTLAAKIRRGGPFDEQETNRLNTALSGL